MFERLLLLLIPLGLSLVILNYGSAIIALIWLIILSDFSILITAFFASFISTIGLALLMSISFVVALPALFFYEKGGFLKILAIPLFFISGLWNYGIIAAWTLIVFTFCIDAAGTNNIIPYVLLAYVVSTTAFTVMGSKEPDSNVGAILAMTTNQLSSALLVILIGFTQIPMIDVFSFFIGVIFLFYLLGMGLTFKEMLYGPNKDEIL